MWPSNNLQNKTPSDTYWKVQLVFMKIQAHSFLKRLESNQDQTPLMNQGFVITFQRSWELQKNMQFQISSRREHR